MPWKLLRRGGQICVCEKESGEPVPGGCHPTRAKALAHLRALYANVDEAHKAFFTPYPIPPCAGNAIKARPPFDESKVRRHPKGTKRGGQFAPKYAGARQAAPSLESGEPSPPSWHEREGKHYGEPATEFFFDNGVRATGRKVGRGLELLWLSAGDRRGQGLGRAALTALRARFAPIVARDVFESSVGFWEKMQARGLVDAWHPHESFVPPPPPGSEPWQMTYRQYMKGKLLHGTVFEFDQFKPNPYGVIFFSEWDPARKGKHQAEYYMHDYWGTHNPPRPGRLIVAEADLDAMRPFNPARDPEARAIMERAGVPYQEHMGDRVDYPTLPQYSREAIAAGYDYFRVYEPSIQGTSLAIAALDKVKIVPSHREVVERALAEGKPVPAHVLAEYPDLAPPPRQAAPSATLAEKWQAARDTLARLADERPFDLRWHLDADFDWEGAFGLTSDTLYALTKLPVSSVGTYVKVSSGSSLDDDDEAVTVEAKWVDVEDLDSVVGRMQIELRDWGPDWRRGVRKVAFLDGLEIEEAWQQRGLGAALFRQWLVTLADMGFDEASLYADGMIGAYAWAKEGAQYADPLQYRMARDHLDRWLREKGLDDIADSAHIDALRTPRDFAEFDVAGRTVDADAIDNDYVRGDRLPIGKAFMLDAEGHGDWDATIDLRPLRNVGRH